MRYETGLNKNRFFSSLEIKISKGASSQAKLTANLLIYSLNFGQNNFVLTAFYKN